MTDHYEREREAYEAKMLAARDFITHFEQESYTETQEQVVVYAVLAYNDYYPSSDNVKGMFDSYDKAEQFLDKYRTEKEVLVSEWMDRYYDHYKIVDYVLNQPT